MSEHVCDPSRVRLVHVLGLSDASLTRSQQDSPEFPALLAAFLAEDGPIDATTPLGKALSAVRALPVAPGDEGDSAPSSATATSPTIDLMMIATKQTPPHKGDTAPVAEALKGRLLDDPSSAVDRVEVIVLPDVSLTKAVERVASAATSDCACQWFATAQAGAASLRVGCAVGALHSGRDIKMVPLDGGSPASVLPPGPEIDPLHPDLSFLARFLLRNRYYAAAASEISSDPDDPRSTILRKLADRERLTDQGLKCRALGDAVIDAVLSALGRNDALAWLGIRAMLRHLYDRLDGAIQVADDHGHLRSLLDTDTIKVLSEEHEDTGCASDFRQTSETKRLWELGSKTHTQVRPFTSRSLEHLRYYADQAGVADYARDLAEETFGEDALPLAPLLPTREVLALYCVGGRDSVDSPFVTAIGRVIKSAALVSSRGRLRAIGSTNTPDQPGGDEEGPTLGMAKEICAGAKDLVWVDAKAIPLEIAQSGSWTADIEKMRASMRGDLLREKSLRDVDEVLVVIGSGTVTENFALLLAGLDVAMATAANLRVAQALRQTDDRTVCEVFPDPVLPQLAADVVLRAMAQHAINQRNLDLAVSLLARGTENSRAIGREVAAIRKLALQPRTPFSAKELESLSDELRPLAELEPDDRCAHLAVDRLRFALALKGTRPEWATCLAWVGLQSSLKIKTSKQSDGPLDVLRHTRNKSPLSHGDHGRGVQNPPNALVAYVAEQYRGKGVTDSDRLNVELDAVAQRL